MGCFFFSELTSQILILTTVDFSSQAKCLYIHNNYTHQEFSFAMWFGTCRKCFVALKKGSTIWEIKNDIKYLCMFFFASYLKLLPIKYQYVALVVCNYTAHNGHIYHIWCPCLWRFSLNWKCENKPGRAMDVHRERGRFKIKTLPVQRILWLFLVQCRCYNFYSKSLLFDHTVDNAKENHDMIQFKVTYLSRLKEKDTIKHIFKSCQ